MLIPCSAGCRHEARADLGVGPGGSYWSTQVQRSCVRLVQDETGWGQFLCTSDPENVEVPRYLQRKLVPGLLCSFSWECSLSCWWKSGTQLKTGILANVVR